MAANGNGQLVGFIFISFFFVFVHFCFASGPWMEKLLKSVIHLEKSSVLGLLNEML